MNAFVPDHNALAKAFHAQSFPGDVKRSVSLWLAEKSGWQLDTKPVSVYHTSAHMQVRPQSWTE